MFQSNKIWCDLTLFLYKSNDFSTHAKKLYLNKNTDSLNIKKKNF